MALVALSPLSPPCLAWFPHVLELEGYPPVPKPILESGVMQSFCSLAMIPILALGLVLWPRPTALNPSLLQFGCNDAKEPRSDFHVFRPNEVAR